MAGIKHVAFLGKRTGFPVDMLRTIQGWPADTLSSNAIVESFKQAKGPEETPHVVLITCRTTPDQEAWRKAGWLLVPVKDADTLRRLSHV